MRHDIEPLIEQYQGWIVWTGIGAVVALCVLAFVAYSTKVANPVIFGFTACAVSMITPLAWWPLTLTWWSVAIPIITVTLFLIGLSRPDTKDDPWYYGAAATALLGKAIIVYIPDLWKVLTGQVTVPLVVPLALGILAVLGIAGWRSEKVRNGLDHWGGRLRRKSTTPPASI